MAFDQSATFFFSVPRQHNLLSIAICRGCGKTTRRESLFKHLPCLPTSFKHSPHSLRLLPQPTKCFTFVQYFVSVFVEINLNTLTYNIHTTHHSSQLTNAAARPQNGDCPLFTLNKLLTDCFKTSLNIHGTRNIHWDMYINVSTWLFHLVA